MRFGDLVDFVSVIVHNSLQRLCVSSSANQLLVREHVHANKKCKSASPQTLCEENPSVTEKGPIMQTASQCHDFIIIPSSHANSLAPGGFELNFRWVIFKLIVVVHGWGISCETALIWMSLDHTYDKSTLVQVMAWCRQATSHYLSQCWPRSISSYGVTRPQWVKSAILPLACINPRDLSSLPYAVNPEKVMTPHQHIGTYKYVRYFVEHFWWKKSLCLIQNLNHFLGSKPTIGHDWHPALTKNFDKPPFVMLPWSFDTTFLLYSAFCELITMDIRAAVIACKKCLVIRGFCLSFNSNSLQRHGI